MKTSSSAIFCLISYVWNFLICDYADHRLEICSNDDCDSNSNDSTFKKAVNVRRRAQLNT
jgi:hypothetical protein